MSAEPGLLAAMDASLAAGRKVCEALGTDQPEAALTFRGRALDVIVSPLSPPFGLFVALRKGHSALRLAIALDEVLATRSAFMNILAEVKPAPEPAAAAAPTQEKTPAPAPVEPPPPQALLVDDARLASDLAALRPMADRKTVDAFWDGAPETAVHVEGTLSYDEAVKKGMLPGSK